MRPSKRRRSPGAPHDHGYKLLFSHPPVVESLVRGFLPAGWAARLDFSTLERASGSFVSDDLRERHGDLVWKLRWKERPDEPPLHLLLEFQSTPDPSMPVRLLTYAGLLLQELFRAKGRLPLVLPVVVYNGKASWRAPLDLAGLFAPLPRDARRFLPKLRYVLLDQRALDLDRPELARNLAAAIFRIETSANPQDFHRRFEQILDLLALTDGEELRRTITIWLRRKLQSVAYRGIIAHKLEDTAMLEDMLRDWQKQNIREGRQEGMIEGMRWMLLSQLEKRFGPLSSSTRRSVEAIDHKGKLKKLGERVLKAQSLSELGLG